MRGFVAAFFGALTIGSQSQAAPAAASFDSVQSTLKTYCVACHQGKTAAAKVDLTGYLTPDSVVKARATWSRVLARVRGSDMPPKGSPAPGIEEREQFVSWVDGILRKAACAEGPVPGPSPIRRLNREEYSATVRDLLNIQISAGHALPADGAGGEGFDNAAETLFLSPIHAEKYLEAAKLALTYASKACRARAKFLIAAPGWGVSAEAGAHALLLEFLPRAFRRPVDTAEIKFYLGLFESA